MFGRLRVRGPIPPILACLVVLVVASASPVGAVVQGSDPAGYSAGLTSAPQMSQREWAQKQDQYDANREKSYQQNGDYQKPSNPANPAAAKVPPPGATPTSTQWSGRVTFLPDNPAARPNRGKQPCLNPECQEFTLTVPSGAQSLYVRTAWLRADYTIYLFAIDPSGKQYGVDQQDRGSLYDKQLGNSTTLPVAFLSVANPAVGDWKIRVRAAWGLNIDYAAVATLTNGPLFAWQRQDPIQLSKYATQTVDVNVIFAGTTPSAAQIAKVRSFLPDQYRLPVLWWQGSDGAFDDLPTNEIYNCLGLVNWTRCHYSGTRSEADRQAGGYVPFFEPVKMQYVYHFIQADDAFTKGAFGAMKQNTRLGASYHSSSQTAYVNQYNSTQGQFRESKVLDPLHVDLIDVIPVEDWIFQNRYSSAYHYTDMETGQSLSGGFIAPDINARYDPYYDGTGTKNLDIMPQGPQHGLTVFFFDTYYPAYAADYFDSSRYHNFSTMDRYMDVDTGQWAGIDYGRLWGGRYRFAFFDQAAAPNYQEGGAWPNGTAPGGSADPPRGDPPIWEYRNNPAWAGKYEERGLARNIYTMLFSRMTAGFLYRPRPQDIFQLNSTNINDYYSRPDYGTWWTDLSKLYNESIAARWLSAAIPAATFKTGADLPGYQPYLYPGCSDQHVGSKNATTKTVVMAPDATCVGKVPDPLQQAFEMAKAQGDDVVGAGIPFEQAVSATIVRNYWENNRATYAPVADGVFNDILINAVFEQAYTWDLPAIVGGVSFNSPNLENWGQLQVRNDRRKPANSIDCSKSKPGAPGCGGVPPLPTHASSGGLTYIVEHEASHGLGLLHPHDSLGVDKDANGQWNYYWDTLVWMPDSTQSPTTYFADIYPYGVWDQDNLMRGHAGEYIRMAQDAVADSYLLNAMKGITALNQAPDLQNRINLMNSYLAQGQKLFANGDYLHAEYAFKDAYLAASGVTGTPVPPRPLNPGERVFFQINPQASLTRDQAIRRFA